MRKLGILSLTLLAALSLGGGAHAQRSGGGGGGGGSHGGSSGGGGGASSHGSMGGGGGGGSSHSSGGGMSSGGSHSSSGGSSSHSGGSSGYSGGGSSHSSGSSSSGGSRSYDAPSQGSSRSSGGYSSGSRSSERPYGSSSSSSGSSSNRSDRGYEGGSDEARGEGAAERGPVSAEPSAIVNRYTTAPHTGDPVNLDSGERARFPAPYRSGSTRPAVPSSAGAGRGPADPELTGLVDRYRGAATSRTGQGSNHTGSRSTVSPFLDRYGRSGSDAGVRAGGGGGERAAAPGRGASLASDTERYARGPKLRRSPSGSSVARGPTAVRSADGASNARADRQAAPRAGLARPSSPSSGRNAGSSGRNAGARTVASAAGEGGGHAAQGLTRLAASDPKAARRIAAAGGALGNAASLGLAAGVGAISGPAAGAAVRGVTSTPTGGSSSTSSCFYFGYGFYPWWSGCSSSDWCFSFGFSYGCGWGGWYGGCYSPFWGCGWYPYYCYSYNYCYPYYCQPYNYYPYYYSTVVHHVYEDDYGSGGDVVVYADGNGDGYAPQDEPVGEAASGARPVDSKLKTTLSIASERYLTLGDSAFREGRYNDAAQFYAKAAEYAPDQGVLHLVLADALFATGDYHYAAYAIRRALELDPSLADAIVDKHEFYTDPAEFDRHLARLELFLNENQDDSDARLVLAANYLFGNRPAAAVDLLETVSALSLRTDTAATTILASARAAQHGEPAEAPAEAK